MRRRYLRDLYAERVQIIRAEMPHACIGVDVITGFPGETEADFLETYQFLNELEISYLHVFTYSERANTDALEMPGTVPVHERRRRTKMLRILSAKKLRAFYTQHEGSTRPVLFEHENRDGFMFGYTDNYVKVKLAWNEQLANTLCEVVIGKAGDDAYVNATIAQKQLIS
jgi:threonylcarbamoyladenosine tRNA methylthiotransferase MtaB